MIGKQGRILTVLGGLDAKLKMNSLIVYDHES